MKKIFGLLLLCLVCCDAQTLERQRIAYKHRAMTEVEYCKDLRTGLCFAGCDLNSHSAVLALVPCTPEVEALIK